MICCLLRPSEKLPTLGICIHVDQHYPCIRSQYQCYTGMYTLYSLITECVTTAVPCNTSTGYGPRVLTVHLIIVFLIALYFCALHQFITVAVSLLIKLCQLQPVP